MEYFDILSKACESENIDLTDKQYDDFIKYKDMIKEWNKKINLTSILEDEQIIKKHFIDSIKIFDFKKLMNLKEVIDVGTGGGFPGIPMKIVNPSMKITLLDSLNKRINFLNEVIKELNLDDIETIHGRAEDFGKDKNYREKFDAVVSRAVANMTVLSEICLPFVKKGGYFIALKGPSIDKEIEESKKAINILGGKIETIKEVVIEQSDLKHNLVVVKKIKNTPKEYPRKAGIVSKKPLK